ncbi:alpha-1,2-fucosyltransferase [Aphanothece hegewaldii]|nr:alpha-1,2-fucosyltransferase [Aphanothece hegewaldii]
MFQYATARRLAEKHSTILKLDVTGFESYKLHRYSLHCFNIWEYLATQVEIEEYLHNRPSYLSTILELVRISPKKKSSNTVYKETAFNFDSVILEASNNSYLQGYWQSDKYFEDIEDVLRREFTFKYPQDHKNREISQLIQDTVSVSLHIRRTDYVTNPSAYAVHGVCDLDYYERCINYIAEKINNPYFFIFSDDPDWAKENIKINFPTIIIAHNNASKNYEDLRLMSQCQHNIIANSTFSWWGAWLNDNPDKIVCTPRQWFNDSYRDTTDLIPDTWLTL